MNSPPTRSGDTEPHLEAHRLDRSSFVPLYYQLQEILKQQIESGIWQPGAPLPGEPALARSFGVSRAVVRQALAILADDRQITRVKGAGTFVAEPKLESRAGGLYRLLESVQDGTVEIRILQKGVVRIEKSVRTLLGTNEDSALGLTFSITLDGKSLAISHSLFPTLDSAWLAATAEVGSSLPASVAPNAIELGHSDVSIEGSHCDQFESEIFGIAARQPVFLVRSLEFRKTADSERPIELARIVYRSDLVQFRFGLEPVGNGQRFSAVWSLSPSG